MPKKPVKRASRPGPHILDGEPEPDYTKKLRPDVAETAYRTMLEAIGEAPKTVPPFERGKGEKNPDAVKRGAKGGVKRASSLSPETKTDIAREAARVRWRRNPIAGDTDDS